MRRKCLTCDWLKQTDTGPICNIDLNEVRLNGKCSYWLESPDAETRLEEIRDIIKEES